MPAVTTIKENSKRKQEKRAVLISEECGLSYFQKEGDCSLTIPGVGYSFIAGRRRGDLINGQIVILSPTKNKVPNTDDETYYYWEVVREDGEEETGSTD